VRLTRTRTRTDPAAAPAEVDPVTRAAALAAEVKAEQARAKILAQRQTAEIAAAERREAADLAARDRREADQRARRTAARDRRRATRDRVFGTVRPVAPLLVINAGAVYAQAAYAYTSVAPAAWNAGSKLALAVTFALALESISLYVQWHAHDALLLRSHATATMLRRASWLIAAVVAGINYAHFAGPSGRPTPAAVAFALLSLLSPWLWGLHTRRAQHVQLLAEDESLIDESGAEFSTARRRAFPVRSYLARRWSIDHGVRDPRQAWAGYNAERAERKRTTAGRAKVERAEVERDLADDAPVSGAAPVDLAAVSKSAAVHYAHTAIGNVPAARVVEYLADRGVIVSESLVYKARGQVERTMADVPGYPAPVNGHRPNLAAVPTP
jgi:hypothetical protein